MSKNDPVITFTVPASISNERADKILASHFSELSRTQIQKTFDSNRVTFNNKPINKNFRLSGGNVLKINFILPKQPSLKPIKLPLEILFEDEDIVVINKPAGTVVHPGKGTGEDTLVHALLHHTNGNLSPLSGEERPGVVHRLDKDTSGVMVFTKSNGAYLNLVKSFSNRTVKKEYLALVAGTPTHYSGSIASPINRHPVNKVKMAISPTGREARTDWEIQEALGSCALLRCWLHTGRTHQIRVHLSSIGHPILGDKTYGYKFHVNHLLKPKRVLLHAEKLTFSHPRKNTECTFKAEVPKDLANQISILRENPLGKAHS